MYDIKNEIKGEDESKKNACSELMCPEQQY